MNGTCPIQATTTFALKDGVVKNGIIYELNGSGKTNLSLALFDIVNHLSQKWKKPNYYMNFIYAGKPNFPVEFEYSFKFNDQLIEYHYSKNCIGTLTAEALSVDSKIVFLRHDDIFKTDTELRFGHNIEKLFRGDADSVCF